MKRYEVNNSDYGDIANIISLVKKQQREDIETAEAIAADLPTPDLTETETETDRPDTEASVNGQPIAFAELTPDQERFVSMVRINDFQKLLAAREQKVTCLIRPYIPGEAMPLSEPEGATHTFMTIYCEVAYIRAFYGPTGIKGVVLNDFIDTSIPGMGAFRAELRDSFDPHGFAKFVEASVNQHAAEQAKPRIISLEEARQMRPKRLEPSDWRRGPKH
jgi:hypothetical protein